MQPKIIGEFSSFNSHVPAIILLNQNQENRVQAVKKIYERKMQITEKKAGKRKVKKKKKF